MSEHRHPHHQQNHYTIKATYLVSNHKAESQARSKAMKTKKLTTPSLCILLLMTQHISTLAMYSRHKAELSWWSDEFPSSSASFNTTCGVCKSKTLSKDCCPRTEYRCQKCYHNGSRHPIFPRPKSGYQKCSRGCGYCRRRTRPVNHGQ